MKSKLRRNSLLPLLLVGLIPVESADASCLGDANNDTRVTVDELVTSVNNALSGCPALSEGTLQVSFRTDATTYLVGGEVRVTLRLESGAPTRWWATFPIDPPFTTCNLDVLIKDELGDTVFQRIRDDSLLTCRIYDGGPGKVRGIVDIPPQFELSAAVPLIDQETGEILPAGPYSIEAVLFLHRIPATVEDLSAPPDTPPVRAEVVIEIAE
jgi:hypothetical protein